MTKILAIEDERAILDNILEIIRVGGMEPYGAIDGVEGVKKVREVKPDLILCDINMPVMDGYSVLMELRSNPQTSRIPFVFLTAYTDRPFQRHGMNLGATDYITKPFTAKDLLESINAQLELKQKREQDRQNEIESLRNNMIMSLPHELRTPLTGIVTCADMLLMDFDEGQSPNLDRVEQMIRIMHRSGLRLQRMIENYLVYAQIEMFSGHPEQSQILIKGEGINHPMAVVAMAIHKATTETNREDDIVELSQSEAPTRVSENNLNKITYELIDNALKFSQKETPVYIESDVTDDEFVLRVTDKGRGMSEAEIASIGAYMQFNRNLHEQQGIGLGLAIAIRLAELHGGRIELESEPNVGTQATLYLPLMSS